MNLENQNNFLALLLESLQNDFDPEQRIRILEQLKGSNPTDDSLIGAKMLLEENDWDYLALKEAITKTENRVQKTSTETQKRNKINILKYAAVLIPIAFVLGYFINQSLSNKRSIENFYPKEEGLPNYMGAKKTDWDNLMKLYRANNLKDAFNVSEQILVQKPQNDTAIYFHGIISYELKNYKVANADYVKITENKASVFYYDATFRLGFTFKNLKKLKTSKQQFEQVADDANNPFCKKAKEVLKQY